MGKSKQHRLRPARSAVHALSAIFFMAPMTATARDYVFPPSALEGDQLSSQDINLSLFSNPNAQLPGNYPTSVFINHRKVTDVTLSYINGADGSLQPQLTPAILRGWNIRIDRYPAFSELAENGPLKSAIGDYIPAAVASFDFNQMALNLSIPQAALGTQNRGEIDPSRWDDGVPVLFSDYSLSGMQQRGSGDSTSNQYLSLHNGVNLGGWRLRHYATWNHTDSGSSWQNINTWLQHDIDTLKAQFTAGESSTRGDVFDSIRYKGVNLASDDEMLPWSQRGFAPVIRGIASSNAEVSVRQNGYVIYQANVAPGAFEINDLYATTNSGDLEVTVKEADGSEHQFIQPYSSVAVMQRPQHLRFEVTAGRYRPDSGQSADDPLFTQGSAIYGLNNALTLFGGSTVAEHYLALNTGVGLMLGQFGALSTDVTWAQSSPESLDTRRGQSWRVLYSGKIEPTNTSFTLASYRYSTQGYYSFADATLRGHQNGDDEWQFQYNKRNRIQLSLSQVIAGSSVYLNGYQQNYWQTSRTERSLSAGISRTFDGIGTHLAYTYSKNSDDGSDQMLSVGISIPLSRWLPKSWASYNISNTKGGSTNQNLALNGTLLDDDRLSYSLQQSRSNHGGADSSSVYGSYRSQYANLNAGYYYATDNSQQYSYGASGAIVAHPHGVTLSQPLGDQFAVVHAEGAEGIRFQNQRGIRTDYAGNAIIPSLTAYQENSVRVDTTSLPQDVDTDETTIVVIPSHDAAVSATINAHVGYRTLISLHLANGSPVPFGAFATIDNSSLSGIVDDTGTLYLAGLGEKAALRVKWGTHQNQQCHASLTLKDDSRETPNPAGIHLLHAVCFPEKINDQ
ncbi:fimbria/pilus outer membrane usher protein [Yokenella regensburgei]|uniref:fimbria/pilus outer membrane usher protein n=1 Tax=Yokenella regensburgei TaxID=158877 RepID=UPI003EDB10DF